MKFLFSAILSFSIVLLSGCVTPLTGVQHCAIQGEYYIGSTSSSHINPLIRTESEQTVVHYNCRRVKTAEEQKEIDQALPKALAVKKDNNIKRWALLSVGVVVLILPFVSIGYIRRM